MNPSSFSCCAPIPTSWILIILTTTTLLAQADDLISARCQAKCLREYELRVKNQTDMRRQLRHEILAFCREDRNCSSCLLPCNENFETDQRCTLSVCKAASNLRSCADSCVFLEKINRRKPGQCPLPVLNLIANECSATCNRDSDCKEAERCCTQGCSRVCMMPVFADDNRLLPVPEGISVQERKRKRSAIIRWVMKRMAPAHTATNSNLYVIQWRWGIRRDSEVMTPWQTIVVKNKMYAILKHLLSSGRYYIFRVAAVNTHGSAGFSKPSQPFKLTKQVRAPGPPQNLTVVDERFDNLSKLWIVNIAWQPPVSELPLRDYLLSWWKSSLDGVELYERQMGQKAALVQRSDGDDDEEEDTEQQQAISTQDRRSTILPSYSTRASLTEGLQPDSVYVIELCANVDSSEGELRGEPIIHVLRTQVLSAEKSAINVTLAPLPPSNYYDTSNINQQDKKPKVVRKLLDPESSSISNDNKKSLFDLQQQLNRTNNQKMSDLDGDNRVVNTDDSTIFHAEIQTAYLENSNLRSTLSWLDHPKCTPERRDFNVRLQSVRCQRQVLLEQLASQCVAMLEQLYFSCDYLVEVRDIQDGQLITRLAFSTPPCSQTPSNDRLRLDCRQHDEQPTLRCLPVNNLKNQESGVECEWQGLENELKELVGFRTILTSSRSTSTNISIVAAGMRIVRYERLEDGADYKLKVQALTTSGLGTAVETEFRTGASGSFLQELNRPGSAKLPFEATYSSATKISFKFLFLFFILFNLFCCIN